MAADDLLVLVDDVVLTPVSGLVPYVRERLTAQDDDVAISRPNSRANSILVDAGAAAFLLEFRSPTAIVDAVLRHSLRTGDDAQALLERAYPLILAMRRSRMIAVAGGTAGDAVRASLEPGAELAPLGLTTVRAVHVLEDTEVHEVRDSHGTPLALKLLSPTAPAAVVAGLEREAAVLRLLDGDQAPRLVDAGELDGRRFILVEWIDGAHATVAASRLRADGSSAARTRLLELGAHVIESYAALHRRGVVHADVHPKNVLADAGGRVRLVDFALARAAGLTEPYRAGVSLFYEPEYAAAMLAGRQAPPATEASEQYQVAALVHLLLTGVHALDVPLERTASLRAIAEEMPRTLALVAAAAPGLDLVLLRALSKDPLERYARMDEFAADYQRTLASRPARRRRRPARARADAFVDAAVERLALGSRTIERGLTVRPTVSLNYGAAGIGYALRRLAHLRDDALLLAAADAWTQRALATMSAPGAFHEPRIEITLDRVGPVSLFHSETGVRCVAALVADSRGSDAEATDHVRRMVELARGTSWANPDATVGLASVILGCCELLEQLDSKSAALHSLHAVGEELVDRTFGGLRGLSYYGAAHGDAGILYAGLRFARATGGALREGIRADLDRLLEIAQPAGDALRWPRGPGRPESWAGWCHGSAGWALLWLEAYRAFGDERYATVAERAGLDCVARPSRSLCTLCCGAAGQAYAALALHRASGDRRWLRHADTLADIAVRTSGAATSHPGSLYKGDVGVVLLAAEIGRPSLGAMPLFEPSPRS